jgi:hypothetical protein
MPLVPSLCDGTVFCDGGVCGFPTLCPDGTGALWIGTASDVFGTVDIAFTFCPFDAFFSGTFLCLPGSAPCFVTVSPIFGTTVIAVDGVTILFDPLISGDGGSCMFNASLLQRTMGGDFVCFDPFGFAVDTGTWSAARCL